MTKTYKIKCLQFSIAKYMLKNSIKLFGYRILERGCLLAAEPIKFGNCETNALGAPLVAAK
jgi:hypothetical protein